MCQAIPRKVIEVSGDRALVDMDGIERWVKLASTCGTVAPGGYVHVYAGIAIERMETEEAEEQLRFLRELGEMFPDDPAADGGPPGRPA
ncbi:hypothetical protein BH18CHL2_BH18CHL2_10130 [soil metagenome]